MAFVTMLFTDVVESSAAKRDASLGRDNRERDHAYLTQVQTPHFAMVRACYTAHGGREVSTMGDAFFLTFEDPTAAVRCAADIQQRLAREPIETPAGPLRLRIGVHSGFPEFFEGSWHGTDVDTAARVASTATERQILVSSRTYELVRQMTDVKFHSRGEFAMKGVERMVLWEADWDGRGPRTTAVPPLDVGRRRKRNLRIAGAVAGTILLVAAGVYFYRNYKNGRVSMPMNSRPTVAVMGFKNLGHPDVEWLSSALSEMLSTEMGSSDAVRTISPEDVSTAKVDLGLGSVPIYNMAALSKIRRMLHSEYVISGAYVAMGSGGGDSIHIDVHLQDADTGEAIFSLGEDGTIGNLPELLRKVATGLRGRLGVQSESQSSGAGSQATAGLPSNPEALRWYTEGVAKLRVFDALGARELLEKAVALEPNLALPHVGLARAWELLGYDEKARGEAKLAVERSRGLPPRDQRLIEAEYHEMNSEWDQAISIYQALWVLYPDEPDYALALANAQTAAGKGQGALGTLEKLGGQAQMKDDPRVDLSVTLAAESLGDAHKQRDAAQASAEKATREGSRLLAAHAYWQLCSAYYTLGEFQKGEEACNSSNGAAPFDDEIKARSQTVLANMMFAEGHVAEALEMRRQALETARRIGSRKDIVGALINLANLHSYQGEKVASKKEYIEAIEVAREINDKQQLLKAENDLAVDLSSEADYGGANQMYGQSLATARAINDKDGISRALMNLGVLSLQLGDVAQATRLIQEAVAVAQQADLQSNTASGLMALGDIQMTEDSLPDARKSYETGLGLFKQQGDQAQIANSRLSLANLELEVGDPQASEALARQAMAEFRSEKLVDNEASAHETLSRALLQEGRLAEAQAEIDSASGISVQDRAVRISLEITAARLQAREGKTQAALRAAESVLAETRKLKIKSLELQARLATEEIRLAVDGKAARNNLIALEKEAKDMRFALVARYAKRLYQGT
jgi:class 3 adenylate cyclase/tetratricopeptide (TPR) repeat protein/TolB-like protein